MHQEKYRLLISDSLCVNEIEISLAGFFKTTGDISSYLKEIVLSDLIHFIVSKFVAGYT